MAEITVITLQQPWASAVFVPRIDAPARMLKEYETRGFAPTPKTLKMGDRLAIQAGKADTPKLRAWWMANVRNTPHHEAFVRAGIADWSDLPFGKIVGHVRFMGAYTSDDLFVRGMIDECERHWGLYGPGRLGWKLADATKLAVPIPCKGLQSLFRVEFSGLPEAWASR